MSRQQTTLFEWQCNNCHSWLNVNQTHLWTVRVLQCRSTSNPWRADLWPSWWSWSVRELTQRGKNGVEIKLMYMQVCRVQPHLLSFKYTHCSTWSTFKEDAVHLPPTLITMVEYRMRRIDHYLLKFCVPKKGLLSMHAAFRSTSLRTHDVTRTHICELPCTSASAAQLSSFGVNTSLKVSTV